MQNALTAFGRPTMSALAVNGQAVRQSLASQAAWFIDPIKGRDSASGTTLARAIQTRTEFARRMFGVTLTQDVTVTVTSSLLAGDDRQPFVLSDPALGFSVNYVGVPTLLFTGTITAYTNRNGATSQRALMTIAGLPVSWTASGLVKKVIEKTDASVIGVVIADLTAKQAWISPPLSSGNLTTNFVNGDVVNVYEMPNMNTVVGIGGFNTYRYLDADRWEPQWGRMDCTSCTGAIAGFGGALNLQNCFSGERFTENTVQGLTVSNVNVSIRGGYHGPVLVGSAVGAIWAAATLCMLQLESGASFNTGGIGTLGTAQDVEFNTAAVAPAAAINFTGFSGQRATFDGYVYGLSSSTILLARFQGNSGRLCFRQAPNVTSTTSISFDVDVKTELLSRLTSIQLNDTRDNQVIGTAGRVLEIDRTQIVRQGRAIITETVDAIAMIGTAITVNGTVYYCAVGLRAGDVVTNLSIFVQTAGTVMTRSRVGLYDIAGNLLAQSADQGASWQAAGLKTIALTAPFTILTTGLYYVAVIAIGTVQPTLSRGASSLISAPAGIGAGAIPFTGQLAQADLPNPGVIAANVISFVYWICLS